MHQNENSINSLFSHLDKIHELLERFKKKNKFLECYLSITGCVHKSGGYIELTCNDELDKITVKQRKEMVCRLREDISEYLDKNYIGHVLILRDRPSAGWAKNGTDIIFEIQR